MAMLGKRFQRTISMSQIGPGTNVHAEKAQAQNYYQQQQQQQGELVGEHQPANQWDILKNAEAMMVMMMSTNSGGNTTSEENPLPITAAAATKTEQAPPRHSLIGAYSHSPATPSAATVFANDNHLMSSSATRIGPTHHFLDACFYCKRRLRPERDIFIYRGDAAFCTEECRHRQILKDENSRVSKKGGGATSETAVAA